MRENPRFTRVMQRSCLYFFATCEGFGSQSESFYLLKQRDRLPIPFCNAKATQTSLLSFVFHTLALKTLYHHITLDHPPPLPTTLADQVRLLALLLTFYFYLRLDFILVFIFLVWFDLFFFFVYCLSLSVGMTFHSF